MVREMLLACLCLWDSMAESDSIAAAEAVLKERANPSSRSAHTTYDILFESWP